MCYRNQSARDLALCLSQSTNGRLVRSWMRSDSEKRQYVVDAIDAGCLEECRSVEELDRDFALYLETIAGTRITPNDGA